MQHLFGEIHSQKQSTRESSTQFITEECELSLEIYTIVFLIEKISILGKRSTAHQWMIYCNSKMAITLANLGTNGPRLSDKLKSHCYVNDQKPGISTYQDMSRLKIWRHSLANRLFWWSNGINSLSLRRSLKRVFSQSKKLFIFSFYHQSFILLFWSQIYASICFCSNYSYYRDHHL